jgi:hypothetical protein
MAIKIRVGEPKTQEVQEFPKLMELLDYGGLYHFTDNKTCYCIDNGTSNAWAVGELCTTARIGHFIEITEPVTLQNQ